VQVPRCCSQSKAWTRRPINCPELSQSKHHLQSFCLLFSLTIKPWFFTEGKDLPLCSSYFPLGVSQLPGHNHHQLHASHQLPMILEYISVRTKVQHGDKDDTIATGLRGKVVILSVCYVNSMSKLTLSFEIPSRIEEDGSTCNRVEEDGSSCIDESAALIRPFCITILYHNLLLFIDIFHI
jgi:hypothetical protein